MVNLLEASQSLLKVDYRRPQKRFTKDGHLYDIYYVRTGLISDGESTDDEFTPYIFKDDVLIEIGWEFLGGTKRTSIEIARENAERRRAKASATKITIKQESKQEVDQNNSRGDSIY